MLGQISIFPGTWYAGESFFLLYLAGSAVTFTVMPSGSISSPALCENIDGSLHFTGYQRGNDSARREMEHTGTLDPLLERGEHVFGCKKG